MNSNLTDAELKAFAAHLRSVDQRLPEAAQPIARNMVQQILNKQEGLFNHDPGVFDKYFSAQLVRFVMAGGMGERS